MKSDTIIWYRPLPPRATIALVAPASPPRDPSEIECAVRYLERCGYRVEVGKSCYTQDALPFLAGPDSLRAQELINAFFDPKIDAIFTIRGGYGSLPLLHRLPYSQIRRSQKLFVGFSDLTALQAALFRHAGLITLSAPFPSQLAAMSGTPEEALFWDWITQPSPQREIFLDKAEIWQSGIAHGYLICGNLTLLATLSGTRYFPFDRPVIGYFEDVNEAPYRIDRMLRQLWFSSARQHLTALLFGNFSSQQLTTQTLMQHVLQRNQQLFSLPTVYFPRYGHHLPSLPLPFGAPATLNTTTHTLSIR